MSSGSVPASVPAPTFAELLWPARASGAAAALRAVVLAVAGSALLAISAKIQVPIPPVPLTMQTLVVLLIGATYGWRLAGATTLLYIAEGMAGLPVFANTPPQVASPAYLLGPTGGYLIGYVAAAMLMGFLAERGWDRSLWRVIVMMTIGHIVIFAFGLAWLAHLFGGAKAWAVGVAPFIAGTVIKTALAAALIKAAWVVARR
ncbi:MAG TPA: biotin transporter BioY [Beijerinckiaceae bacterium]|nr:biotin transporter BioY [Beijerinckiaceae bacterium]